MSQNLIPCIISPNKLRQNLDGLYVTRFYLCIYYTANIGYPRSVRTC